MRQNGPGNRVRLVEIGEMAGFGHSFDPGRAVDPRGELLCIARRQDGVAVAPQDQGRRGDQAEPLFQPGVAERPEGAGGGLGGARHLDRPFDRIGALRSGDQFVPLLAVGAHQTGDLVLALSPWIDRRLLVVEQAERRDQHELADVAREDRRHLGGKRAAYRGADQVGAGKAGLVDELAHGQDPVEMRVELGMAGRAGVARQRGHDHRPCLGEPVEERQPARQAAKAGQEAELGTAALGPDATGEAVDLDGRFLRCRHGDYSAAASCGRKAGTDARWPLASGLGHSLSSPSADRSFTLGMTCSANRRVLYLVVSLLMLPYCSSSMRWPTLRLVATWRICSTTSSGEPTITYPPSTMSFMFVALSAALVAGLARLAALVIMPSMPARCVASVV